MNEFLKNLTNELPNFVAKEEIGICTFSHGKWTIIPEVDENDYYSDDILTQQYLSEKYQNDLTPLELVSQDYPYCSEGKEVEYVRINSKSLDKVRFPDLAKITTINGMSV